MTTFYTSHFSKILPRPAAPKPLEVIGYVHDDISGDLEIQGLVDKNEKDKKIIDLFKAQLLLPINLRSKVLMKRFGIDVSKNGQVDAWPSPSVVRFHVNAYFPEDATIHSAARLAGAKSKVVGLFTEKSTGNTFYFYFPLSISGVSEDNILKLDNFNTWIYRDTGEPVPDRGDEYNIYHALYDQIQDQNLAQSNAFLATKGMYSPEKGVTFTLRNHNIRVESVVRNPGNVALNVIKQQSTNTPAAGVSDDDLNHMLLPIGEDSEDPLEELAKIMSETDPALWADLDLPAGDYGDMIMDIYDPLEQPEDQPVDQPVEQSTNTVPDIDDLLARMKADLQLDQDDLPDDVVIEVPQEQLEQPVKQSAEQPETDIPPVKKGPVDGEKGFYKLQTILGNPKYKETSPFAMLGIKYPDYSVQFKSCVLQGYAKLAEPIFVIMKIDKEKKVIDVMVHNVAHHTHIYAGKLTRPELFEKYNSEFISAGNSEGAFKNLNSKQDVNWLEMRFRPYSDTNAYDFKL